MRYVNVLDCMGVVILCKSGVYFGNQAGGLACKQPSAEGIFVPISAFGLFFYQREKLFSLLYSYFASPEGKYKMCCSNGIDEEDADYLDKIFEHMNLPFVVDRSRLDEAMEAWLPILILKGTEYGFKWNKYPIKAILVWENSD